MFYKIIKKHFGSLCLLFFIYGCVESYYDKNPKLVETNTVDSWKELKVEVLQIKEDDVVFHLWTENFKKVQDSLYYNVLYVNPGFGRGGKEYEDVRKELVSMVLVAPLLGAVAIMSGNTWTECSGGFSEEYGLENDNSASLLYIMGGCLIIGGVASLYQAVSLERKEPKTKIITRTQKEEDSIKNVTLQSVTVSLSNIEFIKNYITDKEGNISVPIEDISPYFTAGFSQVAYHFYYENLSALILVEF